MPRRAGQVMKPQRPALVGLRIGRVAIDRGAEDEIVLAHHGVMQRDAVPVEDLRRAVFQQRAHQAEGLPGHAAVGEVMAAIRGAGRAEIGHEGEEGHQAVHALESDGKPLPLFPGAPAKPQEAVPVAGRFHVQQLHQVGTGHRHLAGGIDGQGPDMTVQAIGCQRRADEERVRAGVLVQRQEALRRGDGPHEGVVENDEIEALRQLRDRRELEPAERPRRPCDLDVRMPLSEHRGRVDQRIDRAPMVPRDAAQYDWSHQRLRYLDSQSIAANVPVWQDVQLSAISELQVPLNR